MLQRYDHSVRSYNPSYFISWQDLSNERFYSALTGPSVLVNTTEYGHLDCLDEAVFQLAASIHLCAANKELDREVYRNYIAGDTSVVEHFSS